MPAVPDLHRLQRASRRHTASGSFAMTAIWLAAILTLLAFAAATPTRAGEVRGESEPQAGPSSPGPASATPRLVPAGTNCQAPAVFDDQWQNGFRLTCQNNMYLLMVDLTNPAIRVEVVAASRGNHTLDYFADENTIAVINADYQWPCSNSDICSQGLTVVNGSSPNIYTNMDHLCSDARWRRQIGLSQDGRPVVDWWYRFVPDEQARAWCSSIAGTGGGLEAFGFNLVGGGPQFTFDRGFRWDCGYGRGTDGNCLASGNDVIINEEHFAPGNWWNRPQSAIGFSADKATLVLAESNNRSHTMQEVHDIMDEQLLGYGKTLKDAFKFDGGSKAGFWYYNHAYDSTPAVTVPNAIRVQRTNARCYSLTGEATPPEGGSITVGTPSNCAQGKYVAGSQVVVSAIANPGYIFTGWGGDLTNSSDTITITVERDTSLTANFVAQLVGRVDLEGRGAAPDERWRFFPLTVTLHAGSCENQTASFSTNTDDSGGFILQGVVPGVYSLRVKNQHTLSTCRSDVSLPNATSVYLGTLLAGDANGDDCVLGADFSLLRTYYGKCQGDPGWDARADFNGDGCILGADFSLLRTNYARCGPVAVD